jgi:SLOG family YspA-like protein
VQQIFITMKTIIAGSRTITDPMLVWRAIDHSGFEITEVVSGAAKGVDQIGEVWGLVHFVPVKYFEADWDRYGKSAGAIRNVQMAEYADALIAVWDGKSPGTKNMIETARKRGLKVFVSEPPEL